MRQVPNYPAERQCHLNAAQRQGGWPLQVSAVSGALSQLFGFTVLAGWWFGVARIVQPIPGLPAMAPSTAEWSILLGTSLLLLRPSNIRVLWRRLAQVCALVVVVLATTTLADYAWSRLL